VKNVQEMEKRLKAALFIDGQSMLDFDFKTVNEFLQRYDTVIKRVYITKGLIEYYKNKKMKDIVGALYNNGFKPILTAHLDNVDSYLLVDATETICTKDDVDVIIIATGDSDMTPLFYKARLYGKKTVLMHKAEANNHKVCCALKNAADEVVDLSKLEKNKYYYSPKNPFLI